MDKNGQLSTLTLKMIKIFQNNVLTLINDLLTLVNDLLMLINVLSILVNALFVHFGL